MVLVGFFISILFITLLYHYMGNGSAKSFIVALIIKLSAGLFIGYLYSNYYSHGGDTFSFFEASTQLSKLAREKPLDYIEVMFGFEQFKFNLQELSAGRYDRSLPVIKLASIFNLLTGDNYWLVACLFSLLSFSAAWYLYLCITNNFLINKFAVWLALFAWPSTTLWTSGLTKDSLAFACLCLIFAITIKLYFKSKIGLGLILTSAFALWILWLLKYYYAAIFVVCFLPLIVVHHVAGIKHWSLQRQYVVYIIAVCVIPLGLSILHPNLLFTRLPSVIFENHQLFIQLSSEAGAMQYPSLQPNWGSILLNAPKALLAGLFLPLSPEEGNVLRWFVLAENYLFIIFLLSTLPKIPKLFKHDHALLIVSLLVYAVVLAVFLAISSPNYGTFVRFKIGFMPFLLIIILSASPLVYKFSQFVMRVFPKLV